MGSLLALRTDATVQENGARFGIAGDAHLWRTDSLGLPPVLLDSWEYHFQVRVGTQRADAFAEHVGVTHALQKACTERVYRRIHDELRPGPGARPPPRTLHSITCYTDRQELRDKASGLYGRQLALLADAYGVRPSVEWLRREDPFMAAPHRLCREAVLCDVPIPWPPPRPPSAVCPRSVPWARIYGAAGASETLRPAKPRGRRGSTPFWV